MCPDVDPSLLGIDSVTYIYGLSIGPFSGCSDSLSQYNCASDLGFAAPAGGKFLAASDLVNGTATLSNGAGTVTSPASGTVFTYTNPALSQVYTITAASANAASTEAATTTSAGGKATGKTSKSSASSTSAGSTASATSKSGSGKLDINSSVLGFGIIFYLTVALAL